MRIPLNITVNITPDDWRDEYGLGPLEDIREDVRSYFLNNIQVWLADRFGEDGASAHRTA